MNQVEFLLRLSENAQEQGDEIAQRHHQERLAHAKQLTDLWNMIELARTNIHAEMLRFNVINPAQQKQQPPEVAGPQQGPLRAIGAGAGNAARTGSQPRTIARE